MSQVTDRTVAANPSGFDMRTELNNIIGALETCNSGASEPLNTVAFMDWFDTSNATYYYLKKRNHDNTAWNTVLRYTVATKVMEAVSNGVVINDSNLVHKTGDETIAGIKTFSSTISGSVNGNSATATKLATARTIQTDLGSAGGASFDGTANVTPGVTGTLSILNGGTGATTAAGALANIVGYTPIQQGGGTSQGVNKLYIGWGSNGLNLQVDATNFATTWPISISGTAAGDAFVANDIRAKTALNATGDAPIYACRAWVNFNGTGTVAIRASGDVSSITDNGVGDYTVNFTTAMLDANYSTSNNFGGTGGVAVCKIKDGTTPTVSGFTISTLNSSGFAPIDVASIHLTIVR